MDNSKTEREKRVFPAGLPHIAYVVLWFPLFTQPFIFREARCLGEELPMEIYTLYGKNAHYCSEEMRSYNGKVHRFGVRSLPSVCWRALLSFFKRPALTWKLFAESFCRRWPSLEILGENLWGFCVGVSLAEMFKEEGIDMVYAPWPRGAATAARVGAILSGLPFALAARGDNLNPADPDLGDKFKDALFIRANNLADQERIENFGDGSAKGKTELVYNSFVLPKSKTDAKRRGADGKIRLLAVGRFDVTKGFDDLLKACAILKARGVDFHLTLAGGGGKIMGLGNLEKSLRKMREDLDLAEHVSMPGFVSHDELPGLLKESDIFVAPCVIHSSGRRDGIPNTVIEAMAHGLPVISTNINALPEVVRHEQTGLAVNPGAPEELADAIIRLARNPEEAAKFSREGAALAQSLFNCQKNAQTMAALFISRRPPLKTVLK